jgi:hypothetical protein
MPGISSRFWHAAGTAQQPNLDHITVLPSQITQFDDRYMCSFCGAVVDMSTLGLLLTVKRLGNPSRQELFAHPACLGQALHPSVPFDPEMFNY